jgi:hypothetical protein
MSIIKTESISSLNNLGDTNNIDLSDDGTTTFNGPIVADRVKAGSSNLQYDYRTRNAPTVIPIPSWATEIEIDFYKFSSPTVTGIHYNLIRSDLAVSIIPIFSSYSNTYERINNNAVYGVGSPSSGRFGTIAGTPAHLLYLFQDGLSSFKYEYTGTIRYNKVNFQNQSGGTYIIYYVTLNCTYYEYNTGTVYGVFNSQGWFYGDVNSPDDILQNVAFGNDSVSSANTGSFNAKFREEDPGTLITT